MVGTRDGASGWVYARERGAYLVVGFDIELNLLSSKRAHSAVPLAASLPGGCVSWDGRGGSDAGRAYLICILLVVQRPGYSGLRGVRSGFGKYDRSGMLS